MSPASEPLRHGAHAPRHLPIAARRGGDERPHPSTDRLNPPTIPTPGSTEAPFVRHRQILAYTFIGPVAGRGARPCELVAAGTDGAGFDGSSPERVHRPGEDVRSGDEG